MDKPFSAAEHPKRATSAVAKGRPLPSTFITETGVWIRVFCTYGFERGTTTTKCRRAGAIHRGRLLQHFSLYKRIFTFSVGVRPAPPHPTPPPLLHVSLSLAHNLWFALEPFSQMFPSVAHCTELRLRVTYCRWFPSLLCMLPFCCEFGIDCVLATGCAFWSRKSYQMSSLAFSLCLSSHTWN